MFNKPVFEVLKLGLGLLKFGPEVKLELEVLKLELEMFKLELEVFKLELGMFKLELEMFKLPVEEAIAVRSL